MIRSVVVDEFGAADLEIVGNMDFGHTDPQWILPLGVTAELEPLASTFRLVEPAFVRPERSTALTTSVSGCVASRRIQAVVATSSANRSAGVSHLRVLRGRPLRSAAI